MKIEKQIATLSDKINEICKIAIEKFVPAEKVKVEFVVCFPNHTWSQNIHEVPLLSTLNKNLLLDWASENLQHIYPTAVCFGVYHIYNNESI